jgi:hypothetical protein
MLDEIRRSKAGAHAGLLFSRANPIQRLREKPFLADFPLAESIPER